MFESKEDNNSCVEKMEYSFRDASYYLTDTYCLHKGQMSVADDIMLSGWCAHGDSFAQYISLEQDSVIAITPAIQTRTREKGETVPVELHNSQGVMYTVLFSFFLLVYALRNGFYYFKNNRYLLFADDSKLDNTKSTKDVLVSVSLTFVANLMFAVVCYEGMDQYFGGKFLHKNSFLLILFFGVIITMFMIFKSLIYRLYGYVFDLQGETKMWEKSSIVLQNLFGVVCFIPVMILVYSNLWHDIIIIFALVCFLLVQLFLFFRLIIFFISKKYDYLYLIVYLCTIELIPYAFLGVGLLNLYKIDII